MVKPTLIGLFYGLSTISFGVEIVGDKINNHLLTVTYRSDVGKIYLAREYHSYFAY